MSKTPIPLQSISQLVELADLVEPKSIIIPGGDRPEDLAVFKTVTALPFVKRCLLVGDLSKIKAAAQAVGVDVPVKDIIPTKTQEESAEITVDLVMNGEADIILKGNISTLILNRQVLRLKTGDTMSLCTLFQSPFLADNRPILLSDAGVTTVCNFSRMSAIIKNAGVVARSVMGLSNPKVAVLSANEKVIPSLASSVLAKDLSEATWKDMTVYGPLSFDLATSAESVRLKGVSQDPDNPMAMVAGKAEVLIAPGLDAANILYKVIMALVEKGQAQTAGITMGISVPYIILSRSDNAETKVNSVALCAVFSEWKKMNMAKENRVADETAEAPIILAVNPGSTSTKLGLFKGTECLQEYTVNREAKIGLRGAEFEQEVTDYIREIQVFLKGQALDAIVGRGGFLNRARRPVKGGVYQIVSPTGEVNDALVSAVRDFPDMDHPSNYGIPIAAELARGLGVPAYMTDAVVADDFTPQARFSGYKGIERKSTAHFLSLKAMGAAAAEQLGRPWDKVSLVCTHMGGGITIAAYHDGLIVDNSIALLGGGSFSPQRVGTLPLRELIDLCFCGRFSKEEMMYEFSKKGGLVSYLGEDDMRVIQQRIDAGDGYAQDVVEAMAYQVSKEIGAMFIAAGRQTEALVFSGGLVHSKLLMDLIKKQVGHLAPMMIFKENLEMRAMARGALLALSRDVELNEYNVGEKVI